MIVIPQLRTAIKTADNLEKAVDLAYSFRRFGIQIQPFQNRDEITDFAQIARSTKPKIVLEIGPGNGGSLFLLSRAATPDAILVSIDLPAGGLFGAGHPKWMDKIFALFAMESQSIHLVRGNSHESSTQNEVERILNGKEVDLLFIDGDHTLEGVKADYVMYSRLVKKGGVVALHDILPRSVESGTQVSGFWDEVRGNYENTEIVRPKGAGIGILYV